MVQIRPGSAGLGGTGRHADVDLARNRDVGVAEPGRRPHDHAELVRRQARRAALARNADGAGDVGIAIGGNVTGGAVEGVLKLTLWGQRSDGGVAMTDSRVTFQPVGLAGSYSGQVVGLDGNLVQADVTNSSGDTLRLTISLQIDSSTGSRHRDGPRRVSATRLRPEQDTCGRPAEPPAAARRDLAGPAGP